MLELLREQLAEYKMKLESSKAQCVKLAKNGEDWDNEAKKAAGYMIMIESMEAEIKKWAINKPVK